jgi:hypothetical protein
LGTMALPAEDRLGLCAAKHDRLEYKLSLPHGNSCWIYGA